MAPQTRGCPALPSWLQGGRAGSSATGDPGAYMVVPGETRRAVYEPLPGQDPTTWHHQGWVD
ncbi:hypothetical protein GCM10017673_15070 [Streptosporangium violaceochromogenes]|nr:hypothetical protein GCM10017673_15070 [Streptosporangium violaceochromogenes]